MYRAKKNECGYESPWVAGVATTCPFFMGSVAPGLTDVRTTPSLPS